MVDFANKSTITFVDHRTKQKEIYLKEMLRRPISYRTLFNFMVLILVLMSVTRTGQSENTYK